MAETGQQDSDGEGRVRSEAPRPEITMDKEIEAQKSQKIRKTPGEPVTHLQILQKQDGCAPQFELAFQKNGARHHRESDSMRPSSPLLQRDLRRLRTTRDEALPVNQVRPRQERWPEMAQPLEVQPAVLLHF
jgi:hypothetical protein